MADSMISAGIHIGVLWMLVWPFGVMALEVLSLVTGDDDRPHKWRRGYGCDR